MNLEDNKMLGFYFNEEEARYAADQNHKKLVMSQIVVTANTNNTNSLELIDGIEPVTD